MSLTKRCSIWVIIAPLVCLWYSCCPDKTTYSNYMPILMSRDQLNTSVLVKEARIIDSPGVVVNYGKYILLNDLFKGVHIIDNSDSTHPQKIKFIVIPGNVHIDVKGHVLYANNATDLVAIDMSDMNQPNVTKRIMNVFEEPPAPDGLPLKPEYEKSGRPANSVVVYWIKY